MCFIVCLIKSSSDSEAIKLTLGQADKKLGKMRNRSGEIFSPKLRQH